MDSNSFQGGQPASGGGNVSTPSGGAGGSGTGVGSQVNNPNLAGGSGSPSVLELSEDSMVKLPGAKDPVRWGDHNRNFQSEFTKRAQEASRLRQELARYKQQIDQHEQAKRNAAAQQQQAPKQNRLADLGAQIKSLSYLSGEDAARVVDHITQELGTYGGELQKRDMALALMYKQMKTMEASLNGMVQKNTFSEFDGRVVKAMKENGIPDEASDWAKEVYLAYEPGEALDREFPQILRKRWEQLQGFYKAQEKRRVDEARKLPFVPGRGGNGTPSKPLANFAKSSAKEIADAVWPGMVDGDVET